MRRTTALVLDAVIREQPDHPAIPKLVRGLLDARVHGRWHTTQENLSVLRSLKRYFDAYEKTPPSYTGKLWFGNAAYAEASFDGHSTKKSRVMLDWPTLGLVPARTAARTHRDVILLSWRDHLDARSRGVPSRDVLVLDALRRHHDCLRDHDVRY